MTHYTLFRKPSSNQGSSGLEFNPQESLLLGSSLDITTTIKDKNVNILARQPVNILTSTQPHTPTKEISLPQVDSSVHTSTSSTTIHSDNNSGKINFADELTLVWTIKFITFLIISVLLIH